MTDLAYIDLVLRAARPRVMSELLRVLRELDAAEEAFQEVSLAALSAWAVEGPPRDPGAWLIAHVRGGEIALQSSTAFDSNTDADDILRLLFVCCHPELPATQQLALSLRLVCGLTVAQIARAFVVDERAMARRIAQATQRATRTGTAAMVWDACERAARARNVGAVLYLMFNAGYSASGAGANTRAPLCEEAIRLARLLASTRPDDPELLGLLALMLLQDSRALARIDAAGSVVLLDDQDRKLWDRAEIEEGLALLDRAMQLRQPGSYQLQAAIAATHARAESPEQTDWAQIERLYAALERVSPSPVVALNRAVAISKVRGADAALQVVEPLESQLDGYFYFHGMRGKLLAQLGRAAEAQKAWTRAIGLANTPAEAAHIRMQLDGLQKEFRRGRPGLRSVR